MGLDWNDFLLEVGGTDHFARFITEKTKTLLVSNINSSIIAIKNKTRLSYYNVTTRLVDLVGLFWLKQNLVDVRWGCVN